MSETERLKFIEKRDGIVEAILFAERTMKSYRKAVLCSRKRKCSRPHFASTEQYRRSFIESYCEFKKYIKINKDQTK